MELEKQSVYENFSNNPNKNNLFYFILKTY